ncbi:hypothetical protein DL96DRAFT_1626980 [Flagelloscypha sp. PMI_526]|nr:hypothetical protein DL96DRAFT_1626980 [Flagelloscypha sp. PMI_526]
MTAYTHLISTPAKETLPLEIILTILDLAFHSSPNYAAMRRFLLLSRSVCRSILPWLYHTLDFDIANTAFSLPHSIDRTIFAASAQPSSLLFTRRIISRNPDIPFQFSLFSQLTHLCLWGYNYFEREPNGPQQAHDIVMLPLEELFVYGQVDNEILLTNLTVSATVRRTLQRFGCHTARTENESSIYKGWLDCPNLVQVIVFFSNLKWLVQTASSGVRLPASPAFRSFILSPLANIGPLPPKSFQDLAQLVRDRRLVVIVNHPPHLFQSPRSFWVNQTAMWRIMLHAVEMNVNANEITFIDNLPWLKVKGHYETS